MAADLGEGRCDLRVAVPSPAQELLDRQPGEDGGAALDQLGVERRHVVSPEAELRRGSARRASVEASSEPRSRRNSALRW